MSSSGESKTCLLVGAGFLGKHFLQEYLFRNPYSKVIVLDRIDKDAFFKHPMMEPYKNDKRITYLWGNSGDPEQVQPYFDKGIHEIVYTAAIADVPYAQKNPRDAHRINVDNTNAFMDYLGHIKYPGRIVLMSSESVYKKKKCLPVKDYPAEDIAFKETDPLEPHSVYGETKMAQESVARQIALRDGLRLVVIRSATMYGIHGRLGQVIPAYIINILEDKELTMLGPGNETSRDFINVLDTVKAIMSILSGGPEIDGETFNIGTGRETFLINLANATKEICGQPSEPYDKKTGAPRLGFKPINHLDARPGEIGARIVLDISKAKEKLRMIDKNGREGPWEPEINLIDGLKNTIFWLCTVVGYDEEELDQWNKKLFPDRFLGKR